MTDLDPAVRDQLDRLLDAMQDDAGAIDHVHAISALALDHVLTVPQVQHLCDRAELCPMHLCDGQTCADDDVQVCADVRHGVADLPDDFDFANPPTD